MKEKTKKFVVYKITNIDNGKAYIGITNNYKRRMRDHFNANKHSYIHNSIKKHGKEKFNHKIICYCDSQDTLCKMEIEFIKLYNTKVPNGYNLTDGGENIIGYQYTDKDRKKMSESRKGKKRSLEFCKKMSIIAKNQSKEKCKKISEANKNHIVLNKTRKKISDANRIFSINQVLEIRKMLLNKISQYKIAKKFNVQQPAISRIKRNERYAEIQLSGEKL